MTINPLTRRWICLNAAIKDVDHDIVPELAPDASNVPVRVAEHVNQPDKFYRGPNAMIRWGWDEGFPARPARLTKRLRTDSTQAPPIDCGASATSDRRLRSAAFGKEPRLPLD
jgi:hypothetical protein